MMIKYTQQYLTKLEFFLKENFYEVRYEKGNFRSGYCILEDKKVVVVNKFATVESRIQALYEISQTLLKQGKILHDARGIFLKSVTDSTSTDTEGHAQAEVLADETDAAQSI